MRQPDPGALLRTVDSAAFAERRCIELPGLVPPSIIGRLRRRLDNIDFEPRCVESIGDQHVSHDRYLLGLLHLILNADPLRRGLEVVTATRLGGFRGTILHNRPGRDTGLGWHSDRNDPDRLLGCTVNLGGAYEGGRLQLADLRHRLLADVTLTRPGDAVVFAIGSDVRHRVTPVVGREARLVASGWYHGEPALPFVRLSEPSPRGGTSS